MDWGLFWSAFGGITQLVTVGYLIYQFHYLPGKEKKEMLFNLEVLWGLSRQKAINLIDDLAAYSEKNNHEELYFLTGVTFKAQIAQLIHLRDTDLSNDVLKNMRRHLINKELIMSATNSLNEQIKSFTLLEAHFNTIFKFQGLY